MTPSSPHSEYHASDAVVVAAVASTAPAQIHTRLSWTAVQMGSVLRTASSRVASSTTSCQRPRKKQNGHGLLDVVMGFAQGPLELPERERVGKAVLQIP